MAVAGFYHDPTEDSDNIECFSCGTTFQLRSQYRPGQPAKREVLLFLLSYHADECFWAQMLRVALSLDLTELQTDTEQNAEQEKFSYQANRDRSSVGFSLQVDGTGKMTFQNGSFSFVYDN
ncbi:hypothetical protein M433DRAFT_159388 [Acidomyces richmondensis BFW]|nr:MAG: hypothetical protein FE78DRAFT_86598 [Acidomyces sp. 'richmondensis']KYG41148.1 hypothetical protein M433DRAFT_159388 [Acidomyces richmondensis BFW]